MNERSILEKFVLLFGVVALPGRHFGERSLVRLKLRRSYQENNNESRQQQAGKEFSESWENENEHNTSVWNTSSAR